ncbi:MAG TPA: hypothetical protein VGL86_21410 [Polyangia bacterium]
MNLDERSKPTLADVKKNYKRLAQKYHPDGDVSLIVEIEVAVQVAPRGFSGFQMTRSRHEEELQQLG